MKKKREPNLASSDTRGVEHLCILIPSMYILYIYGQCVLYVQVACTETPPNSVFSPVSIFREQRIEDRHFAYVPLSRFHVFA